MKYLLLLAFLYSCSSVDSLKETRREVASSVENNCNDAIKIFFRPASDTKGSTNSEWIIDEYGARQLIKKDVKYPHLQTSAEVISSKIYEHFGYNVPKITKSEKNGVPFVSVEEVKNVVGITDFRDQDNIKFRQLKIIAAYLIDWDRISNSNNNLVTKDSEIFLIDFGGSLGSRARGEYKPGVVSSPATGSYFHHSKDADFAAILADYSVDNVTPEHPWFRVTDEDIIDLIPAFLRLDEDKILSIVEEAKYPLDSDKEIMKQALLMRRDAFLRFASEKK